MERIRLCARNNADFYSIVCEAHGVACSFDDGLLEVRGTPPRFYGRAVTLEPSCERALGARGILDFKDSFNDVNGVSLGAVPLFTASWIWRDPASLAPTDPSWKVVSTPEELSEWEAAWALGDENWSNHPPQFPAVLLERPEVHFLGKRCGGRVVAGALLNRSTKVIGVSNVFSAEDEASPWPDIIRLAHQFAPGLALVGYERGSDLELALAAGFEVVGSLTVWVRPPSPYPA